MKALLILLIFLGTTQCEVEQPAFAGEGLCGDVAEDVCGSNSVCVDIPNEKAHLCQCEDSCRFHSPSNDGRHCVSTSYLTPYEEDCPCYCGGIQKTQKRECVWFERRETEEGEEAGCERFSSDSDSTHCGGEELVRDYYCFNGSCIIDWVQDKTDGTSEAGTWDGVSYVAVTQLGGYCNMGKLDNPFENDRQKNTIDYYKLNEPCNACMLSSTEVFNYLLLTIDGHDGWLCDWVNVSVNGNTDVYYNGNWLDDHQTLKFDN